MLKAIIFDMDGVLVDSIKPIWKSFEKVLQEDNQEVKFSDEYIKNNLVRSLKDSLQLWKEEFNIKDYDVLDFSKRAGKIELEFLNKDSLDKDLAKLLKQAKKENIKLGVATSSLRWRAEKILEILDISEYFGAVVTVSDVKNHKPAPDIFLETAKRLNVEPEDCVVIEDAGTGIIGANAANMKTIGLITKYHTEEELSHADLTIKGFFELSLEKIKQIF